MYKKFGIEDNLIEHSKNVEKEIEPIFKEIDQV